MSKYTKGPWTARNVCNNGWNVWGPKIPYEGSCDFIEDDARLMAAAPEMAEMLLSMFSHVSHGGPTRAEAEELLKKVGVIE
jgi:hypothetical protein